MTPKISVDLNEDRTYSFAALGEMVTGRWSVEANDGRCDVVLSGFPVRLVLAMRGSGYEPPDKHYDASYFLVVVEGNLLHTYLLINDQIKLRR